MSIINEPFLVNPPKGRRKLKHPDQHRPLLFGEAAGPWRRSHKTKRKLAKLVNPFGGSLMIAGLNPRRKHKKRSHKKHRKMHLGALSLFGGHSGMAAKHNKHRRHHRRNPALALGGFGKVTGLDKITSNMGNILTGGLSLIVTPVIPRLTGFDKQPWQKYGMELVSVLGGSFVLGMFGPTKRYSGAWVVGGAAGMAAELIRQYVIPMIPGMSAFKGYDGLDNYVPGYPAFGPGYVPLQSLSGVGELGYDTLGAFPGSSYEGYGEGGDSFGAFPDEGSAYTPFIPEEGTSVY